MAMFRYTSRSFVRELGILAVALVWAVPFYLLILVSFKSDGDLLGNPLGMPSDLDFSNYSEAWQGTATVSLAQALLNSIIITVGSVVFLVAIGSVCAYAIARRGTRLSGALYGLFVVGSILPFQLGIVPAYAFLRQIKLAGTYPGMILLYTGLLMPITVFLYTGFVRTLPRDYEEAANVDGASRLQAFTRIVFPLLRPVTATVAVLTGVMVWNDFFVQLVFLSGSKRQTVPVAVYSFVGEYVTQWNLIFAAVAVSILPIVLFYVFAQKQLIQGFTGGIKS